MVAAGMVVAILALTGGRLEAAPAAAPEGDLSRECELGITLALSGTGASAESVFVSLLSRSPGDARALNNLGNIHLWRGEPDIGLAFYDQAREADSTDAGILLNEATALMLAGDDEDAKTRAAEGVARAGGARKAANLLGLHLDPDSEPLEKGADRAQLSRDEVVALLRAATRAVPADSTGGKGAAGPTPGRGKRKAPVWRSAGARGNEGTDVGAVLYWKH
jgi:Flp pilus assembly protein TadD